MSRYRADGSGAVDQLQLHVGDRLKLEDGGPRWWTVQAVSDHFAVVVQQAPFHPKGTLQYSVLDWRNGVRGPCDLIGQGYGDGSYTPEQCAEMLAAFEWDDEQDPARLTALADGEKSWSPTGHQLHVPQRNWVRLAVLEYRPVRHAGAQP